MDLDDWEYLPDAAYLLRHHDDDDHRHHRGVVANRPLRSYVYAVNSVFDMDYFSTTESHLSPPAKLFIPGPQFVPFQFRSPTAEAEEVVKRLMEDTVNAKQQQQDMVKDQGQDGAVAATQVFFKSNFLKETNEFVDMKFLDSTSPRSRALIADFRFDEAKTDGITSIITTSPRKNNEFDLFNDRKFVKFDDQVLAKNDVNWIGEGIIGDDYAMDDDGGFNLWKLGFGGIGAICSFGVAAATICLLIFGNNHNPKQNHKLMFQIYADDNKRMKQVVDQATKFNEVMSAAVRGVPLNRAQITYGGYYENAL
ncbi:unnamed protein product [Rhodiola kirilowii]